MYDALLQQFNQEAGTEYELRDFQGIYGASNHETFVHDILASLATDHLSGMRYDELLELVTRVCEANGSEYEIRYWLILLERTLPEPRLTDLIFWPNHYFKHEDAPELSPKEILDIALAAKPIILPPSSNLAGYIQVCPSTSAQ